MVKQERDPSTGAVSMKEVPGSEKLLDADVLIIAAGFLGSRKYISEAFGVELNQRTNVKAADGKYATNIPKVFTAGDMHRGQSPCCMGHNRGTRRGQRSR